MNIKITKCVKSYSYRKRTIKRGYKGESIEENTVISNFVIEPLYTVICSDIVYYHAELISLKNDKKIAIPIILKSTDFITIKNFKNRLSKNDYGTYFIGTDNDLSIISKYISDESPKKMEGLNYVGLIKNNDKWEYVDKTTNNEKFIVSDNVFIDKTISLDVPDLEEMKLLKENLFSFNHEQVVYTVLCSVTNCFLHARLKNLGIKTPVINFAGEAGAAKSSTLENIVSPFFGEIIADSASKLKEFASLRLESETNLFPHFIEEYKEHNMTKFRIDLISSIIRSIYDGHSIKRGNSDQTITEYILRSPLFLIGETGFDETAVKERLLITFFAKKTLNRENKKAFDVLKNNNNILKKLGRLLLNESLQIEDFELFDKYNYYEKYIAIEEIPDRIKNNIIVSCVSYELLKKSFAMYGIKIEKNIIDIINYSQKNFNLNFQKRTKSVIENTFEILSTMIERKYLTPSDDYYINDNILILKTMQVYHKLTKYASEHKITEEIYPKKSDFINQVKQTNFYIDKDTTKICGKSVRGLFLDLTKMIDLDFCLTNNLDPKLLIKSVFSEKQYEKAEKDGKQLDLNEFDFR